MSLQRHPTEVEKAKLLLLKATVLDASALSNGHSRVHVPISGLHGIATNRLLRPEDALLPHLCSHRDNNVVCNWISTSARGSEQREHQPLPQRHSICHNASSGLPADQ